LRDRLAKSEHVVVNVPLAMTRTDIGDYLGLTVETVSRTMSKFAREKMLVITPDGVRLLEPNQLRIMGEQ
jgi:CRP/FNR family transcriptional regulator